MLLAFVLLNLLSTFAVRANVRQRRYLVYPDGGPARTQFIIGLGVPVDLKEASVTVGTVIKFQYDLPTNSTEYTSRIYGFANTVSRDMDGNAEEDNDKAIESANIYAKDDTGNDLDNENDTLVDITFDDRRKRSIMFSEGGLVNSIDTSKPSSQLSLEEAIKRQELIDQKHMEEQEDQEPQRMNRWDFYKIIEHMAERYGYTGRPCLLRTICEAAEVPFTHENGLLGEIGHILFTYIIRAAMEVYEMTFPSTPSTTNDPLSHHTDNEYHAAERLGRDAEGYCERHFPECEGSVLDTFTEIGMDTLQKFGLM